MADQKINELPTKTAPSTGDKMLMIGAAEEYQIDYDKLASAILNKLSTQSFSSLDTTSKTVLGAIDELNSKTIANNLLLTAQYTITFDEIAVNSTQYKTINVAKSGYKPIGCVGWANIGSSSFFLFQCSISSNTQADVGVRNATDTVVASGAAIVIFILFVKK